MVALKKMSKALLALCVGLACSVNTFAADETFETSITILAALAITETKALEFPDTESSASAQDVVVLPADGALFNITGEPGASVTITAVNTTNMTGAGAAITVGSLVVNNQGGTLDGSGALNNVQVGATASINANQTAGDYTGTATLTVVYQ